MPFGGFQILDMLPLLSHMKFRGKVVGAWFAHIRICIPRLETLRSKAVWSMRFCAFFLAAAALRLSYVLAADFGRALDLIVQHHGQDREGLTSTLDTLTQIVSKLKDAPDEREYRSIRLLNKSFWERVGSINGGISFMTALGFELVEQQGEDMWRTQESQVRGSSSLPTRPLSL